MSALPVPTNPEPLAALQSRYPAALEHVYEETAVNSGGIRPGEVAANVFDWEDGLRMIVSRERMQDGKMQLHFSASFPEVCRMADTFQPVASLQDLQRKLARWREEVVKRFVELSGDVRRPHYLGASDEHIPHWVITDE